MTDRTARLRQDSLDARPAITAERAVLITEFYQANEGRFSVPVMRARSFLHYCRHKALWIGDDELIVGERGPAPKVTLTFPELTCHSIEDLEILNSREKTHYDVDEECLREYRERVIPYWRGRSMRDRIFAELPDEWKDAYDAGVFTEFMEQRAPGHTVLDGKIYSRGLLDFKKDIARALAELDFLNDPEALDKRETLLSFDIACDAVILLAQRYAALARERAATERRPARKAEWERIAEVCSRVPAHAPRDFHEALQAYWFCHLGVITELNGWDAFSPGHLDQHLLPFYERGLADGSLTKESARELLECFFIKFNNHPAPPKVGVTAAESGTYTDFANINIGGLLSDGSDGSNELSHLLLDIVDEMHLLQPSTNLQLSRKTPDALLKHALRVLRKGYGFPSLFNADAVVQEQLRQGKTLEDARAGGCSGCVEVGAFGKEAYVLTGYFNLPKILELALNNGFDPRTGKQLGPASGDPATFRNIDDLFAAYRVQFRHFLNIKLRGNNLIGRMYATRMPAPFLSVLIDDCIRRGRDYNAGGARYNNTYVQFVGLGSVTDSFTAVEQACFNGSGRSVPLAQLTEALRADFQGHEALRQRLLHRTSKYGNDDDAADSIMRRIFDVCVEELDGRPDPRGGHYRVEMLPTTCHVYFGAVTGALPDGRRAGVPLSEGISPVQGADRHGPTAVIRSASKMDHLKAGGTLLNMKFTPALVDNEESIEKWAHLVRSYFKMDGHHIQFNVVRAETLREAQKHPEKHRDLIVRVAGYSDYFCDLSRELQEEIIARTAHEGF
ncbi:MAG TPA: glycyl radical protein [Verrucomicrobia bacterium]|nr:glycyl radical protein [Verrucomicrobiota bacterium]HOP98127.1 glycyl radical protein [Verrucomicrobiota bacterium]HPU56116.1 glycyl radical protein [Verrucomicrobiota bacterium]